MPSRTFGGAPLSPPCGLGVVSPPDSEGKALLIGYPAVSGAQQDHRGAKPKRIIRAGGQGRRDLARDGEDLASFTALAAATGPAVYGSITGPSPPRSPT